MGEGKGCVTERRDKNMVVREGNLTTAGWLAAAEIGSEWEVLKWGGKENGKRISATSRSRNMEGRTRTKHTQHKEQKARGNGNGRSKPETKKHHG